MRFIKAFVLILFCAAGDSKAGEADTLSAQKKRTLHPMLELGVLSGGQVSNGLFIYKTAKSIEASMNLKTNEKVFFGIGGGFESYRSDNFIPLFLQFKGLAKKNKSSAFVSIQGGYGIVSSSSTYRLLDIQSKGGVFFSPGIGYNIRLKKQLILVSLNYKHQFINVKYSVFSDRVYRNEANLHMLSFKAGLLLD